MNNALTIIEIAASIVLKAHDLIRSGAADDLLNEVKKAVSEVHHGIDVLHKRHVRKK